MLRVVKVKRDLLGRERIEDNVEGSDLLYAEGIEFVYVLLDCRAPGLYTVCYSCSKLTRKLSQCTEDVRRKLTLS